MQQLKPYIKIQPKIIHHFHLINFSINFYEKHVEIIGTNLVSFCKKFGEHLALISVFYEAKGAICVPIIFCDL